MNLVMRDRIVPSVIILALALVLLCADGTFGQGAYPSPVYSKSFLNVKDYGAKGDGSTEDQVALQATIDTANGRGGGTVFLPEGTYIVGATLVLQSNVILMGAGIGSILKPKTSLDANIVAITSESGVTIRDMKIDGNKNNNDSTVAKSAIIFTGSSNCLVENVTIIDMYGQSISIGDEASSSKNVTVRNCNITGGTSNHIDINSSQRVSIINNRISGSYGSGNGEDGIFVGHGLSEDHLIMGNIVDSAGNNGLNVANNKFSAVNSSVRRIRVIGNTFNYNRNNGILFSGVSHSVIANNACIGNNKGGPGGSGIHIGNGFPTDATSPYNDTLGSYRNIISGNRCYDTASSGNIQTYGLHVSADGWSAGYSDTNTIVGNDFSDNNTAEDSIVSGLNFFFGPRIELGVYDFPKVDGSANQIMKTDGSGVLSWATETGGSGSIDSTGIVEETTGTDSTLWNVDQPWRIRAGTGLQFTHGDSANVDTVNISATGTAGGALFEYDSTGSGGIKADSIVLKQSADIDIRVVDVADRDTVYLDVIEAGVDHGGLGGLADDDHPQYLKESDTGAFATTITGRVGRLWDTVGSTIDTLYHVFGAHDTLFFEYVYNDGHGNDSVIEIRSTLGEIAFHNDTVYFGNGDIKVAPEAGSGAITLGNGAYLSVGATSFLGIASTGYLYFSGGGEKIKDITGDGLTFKTPDSSLSVNYSGSGVAITSSRSDHNHDATYETIANVALIGDDTTNFKTAYGWGDHSAQGYISTLAGLYAFMDRTYFDTTTALATDSLFVKYSDSALGAQRATTDASGNTISTYYLPLSGGQMTGSIIGTDSLNLDSGLYINDDITITGTVDGVDVSVLGGRFDTNYAEITLATVLGAVDAGGATSVEIVNSSNPTTNAAGEIAWDSNDDALEVYSGDELESALIPIYQHISIPLVLPDSIQAYVPNLIAFKVNALEYPFGIEIDLVSIQLAADAAYSMVLEEWSPADPPVLQNVISTVTTGATDTYAEEAPDTDGNLDAGDRIVLNIPTTDVPVVTVEIFFHVTEGN